MNAPLILTLPFPPMLNGLYANRRGGGRQKSERYLTWQRAASSELSLQRRRLFPGDVQVEIRLGKPDKRRRDIDGTAKAILDLLKDFAWTDDSQVVDLHLLWADVDGAVVTISEVA